MGRSMRKAIVAMGIVAGATLVGCGDNGTEGTRGGSCALRDTTAPGTANLCFQKADQSLNLETECEAVGGVWSAARCEAGSFERTCEQTVTTGEGEVVYVYHYPAGSTVVCMNE